MADVISFSCNFCGTLYRVPFAQAGRTVQCKQCKQNISVPTQSQAMAPGMLDTRVEMNAGDQVLRKETSARHASTSARRGATSARNIKVPSGRTPSVMGAAPVAPLPVVVAPQQKKSATPIIVAVAAVVVLGAIVTLIIVLGTRDPQSGHRIASAQNAAPDKPRPQPPALSEAEKLRRELDDPAVTAEKALAIYRRAQAANLSKAELADFARRVLNKLHDENGGAYSGAQVLGLIDEFAPYDLGAEATRLVRAALAREPATLPDGKPNEVFLRMQKMLKRENFDFEALLARAQAMIQAEQEGASEVHARLTELGKKATQGWVEAADAPAIRECISTLEALEKAQQELERANPTLLADRERLKKFRAERASRATHWTYISAAPFMLYVQLTEAERKAGKEGEGDARRRAEPLVATANRLYSEFSSQWAQPLGLKRTLPAGISPEERDTLPFEIVVCRDHRSLANYASYIGESFDPGEEVVAFYTLRSQRACVSAQELSSASNAQVVTELNFALNFMTYLFNFHSGDPLLRDEDQRDRGVFHAMLLDRSLLRCILTPVRAWSSIVQVRPGRSQRSLESCTFFDPIDGLNQLLAKWRRPFARSEDGRNIESFGGAAFSARNLVEARSSEHGMDLLRANFAKMPGINESLAESMSRASNFRVVYTAYCDAFLLFLYHFERNGKPVYREGLMKFVAKDLAGLKREEALKGFEESLGLDEAKWKQLEEDFASVQK